MPANTSDFLGEGVTGGVAKPYDPDDEPNPANPGGISNNELRRRQAALARPNASNRGYSRGAGGYAGTFAGGAAGAELAGYNAGNQQTRDAYNATHQKSTNPLSTLGKVARVAIDPIGAVAGAVLGPAGQVLSGPAGAATVGIERTAQAANQLGGSGNTAVQRPAAPGGGSVGSASSRGIPSSPADAGIAPPAQPPGDPGRSVPNSAGPAPAPVTVDRTAYDEEAAGLRQARADFYNELDRLSGVDPFGNQAFLQKATDRAVAQAAGTAAGARGGAAAMAGAQRHAVGVQAQTAARGAQEAAEQGRRDAVAAAQLRGQTVKGIGEVSQQLAANEIALTDRLNQAAELNIRQYLGGRELDQAERDSIRRYAAEVAKIDQQRYATDVGYREAVNANLTAMYQSDNALKGALAAVEAGENLSGDEWLMGIMGLGAGLATAGMKTSDRRAKFDVRDPDMRDLQDYLGNSKGKLYRYKEPNKPGRSPGLNFGPMAQDLAKSKIGRTVLVNDADGQLSVDTGRLALADHAALAALAAEVEKLKGAKRGR